jgi:hypothetical protein
VGPAGRIRTDVLTVGACIVLLALLLLTLPRLPELRRQSQLSGCLGNLRLLGEAVQLYLDDNDGRYPFAGRGAPHAWSVDVWHGLLPYVPGESVFLCPADPRAPSYSERWLQLHGRGLVGPGERVFPASYGYLQAFYRPFDCQGGKNAALAPRSMRRAEVKHPAHKALFNCYAGEWAIEQGSPQPHRKQAWSLLFADGHARLTPWEELNRASRDRGIDERYNLDWTVCGIAGRDLP